MRALITGFFYDFFLEHESYNKIVLDSAERTAATQISTQNKEKNLKLI